MIATLEKPVDVVHVPISPEERQAGRISKRNLEKAVVALTEDGVVVLDNAIAEESLDFLNTRMVEQAKALRESSSTWFNYDSKAQNILQHMIPEPEYLLPDVLANPFAVEVCSTMLGPNPVLRYHKANTNFPGESRQPVHCDVHYEHPRACFSLSVNVILIDCSDENGSTECWPGTHATTNFRTKMPTVKKGGLIIRDMRLWHAGMPNRTADEVRVMLNLTFFANWYRCPMTITFPKSAESKVRQIEKEGGIQIAAEFVDEVDHRTLEHVHDFGQDDKREEFGRWHNKIAPK